MEYGIIAWGNPIDSKKAFLQQKRIIWITTGSSSSTPYKLLFYRLEQTRLCNTYYPLRASWQRTWKIYTLSSTLHGYNTINELQIHKWSTTLMIYLTEAYYGSKKIFNKLTKYTAESVFRKKCLISNLRWYWMAKAFYSTEEQMNSVYSIRYET